MQEKIHVEAVIPYSGKGMFFDFPAHQIDFALGEVKEALISDLFDFGSILPKTKLYFDFGNDIDSKNYNNYLKNGEIYKDNYFTVSFDAELELQHYQTLFMDTDSNSNLFEMRDRYDNDLSKSFIADYLDDIIYEIVFNTNLARPGSLNVWEGVVLINGIKYGDTRGICSLLADAYENSVKLKYPYFSFLELPVIRKWLKDNNVSLFSKPDNKLAIAINCLTYVLAYNLSYAEKLIYSMIGLEALYTKGNNNITEQLNEKIQVYLGSLTDYKKIIKDMYSIRSRFLHGDLPIKPFFLYNNTDKKDYEDEIYNALLVSSSILIRTVQKMIIENKKEINFEYKVK